MLTHLDPYFFRLAKWSNYRVIHFQGRGSTRGNLHPELAGQFAAC
jgi:hypothetical protein